MSDSLYDRILALSMRAISFVGINITLRAIRMRPNGPLIISLWDGFGTKQPGKHDLAAACAKEEDIAVRDMDPILWGVKIIGSLKSSDEHPVLSQPYAAGKVG